MIETEKLILAVETTGLQTANQGLAGLGANAQAAQASFDKIADSVERAKVKIVDYANEQRKAETYGKGATIGTTPSTAAYNQQMNAEASLAMMEKETAEAVALNEEEERRNAILSQRTAIRELQLEAAEAEAAQEYTKSVALERELKIRQVALTLQQNTVIEEEEALILAERQVAAEETILATKKAQAALNAELVAEEEVRLALAKAQALEQEKSSKVYGRGGAITNALRNFGVDENISKSIGIGLVAALALDRVVDGIGKHYDEQRISIIKNSHELEKQLDIWQKMSSTAKDITDVMKLHESITARTSEMRTKQEEAPMIKGTMQTLSDGLQMIGNKVFGGMLGIKDDEQGTSWEADNQRVETLIKVYEHFGEVMTRQAEKHAAFYKELQSGSIDEQITKMVDEQARLQTKVNSATPYSRGWVEYKDQLDEVTKSLEKAEAAHERFADESSKLKDEFASAQRAGAGDSEDKAAAAQARVEYIKGILDEMVGKSVPSAAEAFADAADMTDKERIAVERLALEWQKLNNEIGAEAKKQSDEADKAAKKETERLQKRQEVLENLRAETGIIEAQAAGHNGIAKQLEAQLSYEKEIAALRKEGILDTETQAAAQEKLNAELAKERNDQRKKQIKADDQLAIDTAGKGKRAQRNAEVNAAVDAKRQELEDAEFSPEEIDKKLSDYRKAEDRKRMRAQGRFGGEATPSAANRELGLSSDEDWAKRFGKKDRSPSSSPPAGDNTDWWFPDDLEPSPTEGKGKGEKGAGAGGAGLGDGAAKLQQTAQEMSAAAQALGGAAGAMKEVNTALGQLTTGLQEMKGQIDNLVASVSQLQTDVG